MLPGLFILLLCQLLGEAFVHALRLPVPGPVAGIVLLLVVLALEARRTGGDPAGRETSLGTAADGLLRNLGLLFVPAGVGIVQSLPLISANGVGVLATLVGSTIVTLVVTVFVFRFVARATGKGRPS